MTLSQAITALEDARKSCHASLRNWNNLVALHGENSPEAMQFQQGTVFPAKQSEGDAVQGLLQIEPANPVELLRKLVVIKNGEPDWVWDNEIRLLDQAQRLLSAA